MNGVTVAATGRVTHAPELRFIPTPKGLLAFGNAVDQQYVADVHGQGVCVSSRHASCSRYLQEGDVGV